MNDNISNLLTRRGLTVKSIFIPLSKSRNATDKSPTLNWCVTLQRDGRNIFAANYSAGCAHAPAYNNVKLKRSMGSAMHHDCIISECETGRAVVRWSYGNVPQLSPRAIVPDACDVIHSFLMDAGALDFAGFADWCADYGMDSDSIRARASYDACIACGVALRAGLGEALMQELGESFADY